MDTLRPIFFWLAVVALVLTVMLEIGSLGFPWGASDAGLVGDDYAPPGLAVRYLALTDLILLYGILAQGLGTLFPRSIVGRLQGPVALVLSIIGIISAFLMIQIALALVFLMAGLFMAVPFGTMVYVAVFYSAFPKGGILAATAAIMFLKVAFFVLLILAQQGFLKLKGLMAAVGVSLFETWLIAFLIGFLPFILAPIADVISALVIAILGIVWLLIIAVSSLINLVKVVLSLRRI